MEIPIKEWERCDRWTQFLVSIIYETNSPFRNASVVDAAARHVWEQYLTQVVFELRLVFSDLLLYHTSSSHYRYQDQQGIVCYEKNIVNTD